MKCTTFRSLFFLSLFFTSLNAFSQDIITRVDGTKIYGKIIKEDSSDVFIEADIKGIKKETFINKSRVKHIYYGEKNENRELDSTYSQMITYKKGISRYHFFLGDRILKNSEVAAIISSHPPAFNKFRYAFGNKAFSNLIGFAGGFLMGNALGRYIVRRSNGFETTKFLIGAGITVIAIPIATSADFQKHEAVRMYNESLNQQNRMGFKENIELKIALNGIYVTF
jgi:hypothetical protein